MNCRKFLKHLGDYIDKKLDMKVYCSMEEHISECGSCADIVRELEATSAMVRGLERSKAPAGFEERLKARLVCEKSTPVTLEVHNRWRQILKVTLCRANLPPLKLKPLLAGTVCAFLAVIVILASLWHIEKPQQTTDIVYIETCREQHMSFASANPLADESAIILRERASKLVHD